jgi:hypothetical protein
MLQHSLPAVLYLFRTRITLADIPGILPVILLASWIAYRG